MFYRNSLKNKWGLTYYLSNYSLREDLQNISDREFKAFKTKPKHVISLFIQIEILKHLKSLKTCHIMFSQKTTMG